MRTVIATLVVLIIILAVYNPLCGALCGALLGGVVVVGAILRFTACGRGVKVGGGSKVTFEEFCYPKTYKLQEQQKFVGKFMGPGLHHNSLLVFHRIGGGKTCAAIQIAERWKGKGKRPLILMPASLIPGFRSELRSPCAAYISAPDRQALTSLNAQSDEYQAIIDRSNVEIDKVYQIMSYDKFRTAQEPLEASILIIDEVQNISNQNSSTFGACLDFINANPKMPVVIMSATPIFDNIEELTGIAKLLRLPPAQLEPKEIAKAFAGHVSYFAGAPAFTYPKTTVTVVEVFMSSFQRRWYLSEVENEKNRNGNLRPREVLNSFYIKSRQRANVAYPEGLSGAEGLAALIKNHGILNNLGRYSAKAVEFMRVLEETSELSFMYTPFTNESGIGFYTAVLQAMGWRDFSAAGPGPRRYAVWSGGQTLKEKMVIREVFNSANNDDGSQIRLVIGSPAIKEGVSLYRVRHVHIMEGYWNHSRLEQIYGRAVRYCSHKSLPKADRTVKIYIYAAFTQPSKRKITPELSIDAYMLSIADSKREEVEPYVAALIKNAVDSY